jgi:hypothetical protein
MIIFIRILLPARSLDAGCFITRVLRVIVGALAVEDGTGGGRHPSKGLASVLRPHERLIDRGG